MPTPLTHAVVAGAAAKAFGASGAFGAAGTPDEGGAPRRLWIAAVAVSVLPDADAIGFRLGVPYGSFLGHRGFTHSLLFSLLVSAACALVLVGWRARLSGRWWKCLAFLFLLGASHGALDALTDGGRGIALLAPFDNTRYFMPWRPIPVAPIGVRHYFGSWGLRVTAFEAAFLWLPSLVVLAAALVAGRLRRRGSAGEGPA